MNALDRLRTLEISRQAPYPEPPKPTKAPFDGFVGAAVAITQNIRAAAGDHTTNDRAIDPDTARRRSRAIALLDPQPNRHIAVIAEAGDPAYVTVAIRGVAVGELTIPPERYDGFALLALMQQYGHA